MTTTPARKLNGGESLTKAVDPKVFWSQVWIGTEDVCWPWMGSRDGHNYGIYNGTTAHRTAYELAKGPIPPGLNVCHSCDNPPCCNWRHLRADTQANNQHEKAAKGRASRGEHRHNARLTAETVKYIRVWAHLGAKVLASHLGVSDACVRHVLKGRNWRHVL